MKRIPTWMGICALVFYLAHAIELVVRFPLVNLCWSCNVAAVLISIGLLCRLPAVNALGCFMLALGEPFWLMDIATGGELLLTSPLTHLGVLALSLGGVRSMGLPRHTWWRTPVTILLLTAVTGWLGTPTENVNLAFVIPAGYEGFFASHGAYLLSLFVVITGMAFSLQILLLRTGFTRVLGIRHDVRAYVSAPRAVSTVAQSTTTSPPVDVSPLHTPNRTTERMDSERLSARDHPAVIQYERHINPTLVKLLGMLGYGRLFVKARDVWVWDHQGNRYLDCLAGYGSINIGHNHPRILARIRRFVDEDAPNFVHVGPSQRLGELGARLAQVVDAPLEAIIPTNSGAEAVEAGMKLARAATKRSAFAYCSGSYHGTSLGALSVMGDERMRCPFEPLLPDCIQVPFGDLPALDAALSRRTVAGFVVDPGLCEVGRIRPPHGYLKAAHELCQRHGTLLILDEIQTGLGRMGTLFAYQSEGFVPDILLIAKSLSGAVAPIGAAITSVAVRKRACASIASFDAHSSTFGGNTFSCSVALETLDILCDERLSENSRMRGEELLAGLQNRLRGHPLVRDIRGRGLMVAIELGPIEQTWFAKVARLGTRDTVESLIGQWASLKLLERGLLCQPATHKWNTLKLMPPLTIREPEVETIVRTVGDLFDEYQSVPVVVGEITERFAEQLVTGWVF